MAECCLGQASCMEQRLRLSQMCIISFMNLHCVSCPVFGMTGMYLLPNRNGLKGNTAGVSPRFICER